MSWEDVYWLLGLICCDSKEIECKIWTGSTHFMMPSQSPNSNQTWHEMVIHMGLDSENKPASDVAEKPESQSEAKVKVYSAVCSKNVCVLYCETSLTWRCWRHSPNSSGWKCVYQLSWGFLLVAFILHAASHLASFDIKYIFNVHLIYGI